ncbi:T9SS type A sorting domain-containing protein [Adhaeribacter soli]|uniref:T9SS type A sorting domain-containing protein n=1 Tax=Adhaeribacter soli TaxID=2607655 RepID=A0A5N1J5Z7_9BACT|nr:T9SS type A sorting domain-containing protein [Adhaeribacter soli]KAA9345593.1 T9SS type A sorting domain-containing protein [Adhaeribacter soli]
MKKFTVLLACFGLLFLQASAQFNAVTMLNPVPVTTDVRDKPQAKGWTYDGKQWSVLTNSSGTFLWRLNGTSWTSVLKLSPNSYGHADCKPVGNVTHIFLERGVSSHLVSVEYVPASGTYKLWSQRTSRVTVTLDDRVETATIDIDSKGRMWVASDGTSKINVRWSDPPYAVWSAPITLADQVNDDDIGAVIAIPGTGKIGVMWSDQNARRFGFKTHKDSDAPENWSADEVPASQSALNVGGGMADDHINIKAAGDGTLYCAVKTSYDKTNYPRLALLIRRPSGSWDNLYEVSRTGTRPIVLLNETLGKLRIVYASAENGGDILYRETPLAGIAFGPQLTLIPGTYNYPSSYKMPYAERTVVMASNGIDAVSIMASDQVLNGSPGHASLTVFPNPSFNHSTISFMLPEDDDYAVALYDFKGTWISTLKQGRALAGKVNTFEADATSLPSGLYVVRMQTSKEVKSVRLMHER